jgi:hypothetical protein
MQMMCKYHTALLRSNDQKHVCIQYTSLFQVFLEHSGLDPCVQNLQRWRVGCALYTFSIIYTQVWWKNVSPIHKFPAKDKQGGCPSQCGSPTAHSDPTCYILQILCFLGTWLFKKALNIVLKCWLVSPSTKA